MNAAIASALPELTPDPATLRGKARDAAGFLAAILPLVRRARAALREALAPLAARLPFDLEPMERALFAAMPGQLLFRLDRTLVLEMHVARILGLLEGDTAEARYQSYLDRLGRPEVIDALFREYPVLAEKLDLCLDQWVRCSLELALRLAADWGEIRRTFFAGADPGELVSLEAFAGDRHRDGRTVILVRWSSGAGLVYKPRSLAVDLHFQELCAWLNARGATPPLRTLAVLDRGEYGWAERVDARACAAPDEVARFYERQGAYTMLFYLLQATDFHYENLIAAGEHPVPIDLETLLHPHLGGVGLSGADRVARGMFTGSVLRSGMLPNRVWGNDDSAGLEISGLGAEKGQKTPFGAPAWEGAGTDAMQFGRKPAELDGGQNRPTLDGAEVGASEHEARILRGFASMYRLILEHRGALSSPDGPLARFAGDAVRVILRPSQRYSMLIHESFHPDMLRSEGARGRLFDRLEKGVAEEPHLRRVIPAERADLDRADIPVFFTRAGSTDLFTSAGERVEGFLAASSLATILARLPELDERDLTRQLWLIRASMATLSPKQAARAAHCLAPALIPTSGALVAMARAAGARLEVLAHRDAEHATWAGLSFRNRSWSIAPADASLYAGAPGIALFLAQLGAVTGEQRFTALARAATKTVLDHVTRSPASITTIGAFEGWGGPIYALCHLGALWEEPALLDEADTLMDRLIPLIERDDRLDIIGGAAGAIAGLLVLHHCRPSARALAAATACGDHLIARSQPAAVGIAWPSTVEVSGPLTGFAHGAAGIAWALMKLAAATGEPRFRTAARRALAYERSVFDPAAGNWPDLRKYEGATGAGDGRSLHSTRASSAREVPYGTAWCHGAPGIGLSRLDLLDEESGDESAADVAAAVKATLAADNDDNHSLCHGALGNLELLSEAARRLGDARCRAAVARRSAQALESILQRGWACGLPIDAEVPGLMTGIAGIGYGLLRLAAPERVPSVLTLAPPGRPSPPAPSP